MNGHTKATHHPVGMHKLKPLFTLEQIIVHIVQLLLTAAMTITFTYFLFRSEMMTAIVQSQMNALQLAEARKEINVLADKLESLTKAETVRWQRAEDDARRYIREYNDPKNKESAPK